MNTVNFRKKVIDALGESYNNYKETKVDKEDKDIAWLFFKVKNMDSEKGNILHEFIESVMTLLLDVIQDKYVLTINRKYHKIRKAYKSDEVDYDSVDGIIDQITKAKNKLVSFAREGTEIDERFKAVRKQLFELIFKVIRDSVEDQVDFTQVLSTLIRIILSALV